VIIDLERLDPEHLPIESAACTPLWSGSAERLHEREPSIC
jgi:hypothetical protein